MEITNITIRKLCDNDKMKAVCSVTFDDMLVVHDIKVIECESKRFIAMPSKKGKLGQYSDIVHPITKELRSKLESSVLAEYEKAKDTAARNENEIRQ